MSQLFSMDAVALTPPLTVVTTTETVVATGNQLSLPSQTAKAVLTALLNFTPGTGTTVVTVRIRRGTSITDPLVGEAQAFGGSFTVGNATAFVAVAADIIAGLGFGRYCVTVQQTGAAANGTVNTALLETKLISG